MKQITLFLVFLPLFSFAQDCDCASNFLWMKESFEENDAGFSYAIESKGKEAYENHNTIYNKKIESVKTLEECVELMNDWLLFFRKGHIGVSLIENTPSNDSNEISDDEIREKFKNWETIDFKLKDFYKHLNSSQTTDYEGVWLSEPYEIGIKKVNDGYIGFIIKADGVYWKENQIKLKINADGSSLYYMRDHSKREMKEVKLLGKNLLQMDFITLKRKVEMEGDTPELKRYIKSIATKEPYFEKINNNTTFLRIPSFDWWQKKVIDSIILANKDIISTTPNLIIDLRNNGGGSDVSYYELLPFLYTNPIKTIGVEFLSTEKNNQRMLDYINGVYGELSDTEKEEAQKKYDLMSKHIGEFVSFNEYPVSVMTYENILENPKNIGIIINENNGSTTEQFLLAAKQSKKVKLFGTTTAGVLDISNMYQMESPCENLILHYCLSKSLRIPEMTVDGKGISPDYYINKYQYQAHEWITFVDEILNETFNE